MMYSSIVDKKVILAWILLITSIAGLLVTFPMWLLGLLPAKTMLGITLALSWLALVFEAITNIHAANVREDEEK